MIGNSAYQSVARLGNPQNDAADISRELQLAGFQTVEAHNLDKRSTELSIARFARLAQDADVALFYYAGHGLQYQGQNYLMPIDAKLEDEFSLQFEMTRLDEVISALDRARGLKILILDACRNNPLAERLARNSSTRSFISERGLARLERTQGMIVVYATQSNQVAIDGTSRNSPFTAALVREMREPGLEIGTLLRRVQASVNRATEGKQTPEITISSLGEFYFREPTSGRTNAELVSRDAQRDERDAAERERRFQEQIARLEAERQSLADRIQRQAQDRVPGPTDKLGSDVANLVDPSTRTDDQRNLVLAIQVELRRIGCYIGQPDSNWSSRTTINAMSQYKRLAKVDIQQPSEQLLSQLRRHSGRVCPTICGTGQILQRGNCVAASKPPAAAQAPKPRATVQKDPPRATGPRAAPSRRCITVYGRSFCE